MQNQTQPQKKNDITIIANMDGNIHFVKQLKTPAQLWYYCTVYPEDVTIIYAERKYRNRETSYQDDGYYESIFRLIYDIKWEGSKLEKYINKKMEEYDREQEKGNKTISRKGCG